MLMNTNPDTDFNFIKIIILGDFNGGKLLIFITCKCLCSVMLV